ncbi:MAG: class I SAM-dependent methyltransferase [Bacteroidota bacterium]
MPKEQNSRSTFDSMAADYDSSFTCTAVGRLQRAQVWKQVEKILHNPDSLEILELNCGTGEDAMHFTSLGHKVIATDISENMIAVASAKVTKEHLSQAPVFMTCSFNDALTLFPDKKFDIIFSNFGGLNCISATDIEKLNRDLHTLLKPGGRCVMVVMGTQCCWERLYFILKGNRKQAFRRQKHTGVMVPTGSGITETWYHSPKVMKRLFNDNFTLLFMRPIGLFVPPSYLNPYFQKHSFQLGLLRTLDKLFGGIALFSNFADHYFIAFQKQETIHNESAEQ